VETVEKSKRQNDFSTVPTALGNPAKKRRISTFPPRRRRVLLFNCQKLYTSSVEEA
jgi:hypothetical protein